MKKKQPRKTPCGAEPGRALGVDTGYSAPKLKDHASFSEVRDEDLEEPSWNFHVM
jgi:hypothetical protein